MCESGPPTAPIENGHDVHRATAHRALEQRGDRRADLGGGDPVVRRAGVLFALGGDERAALGASDVARVRAGQVGPRPPLGVELDELALVDHLAQERVVLGARAVDPVDAVGLRERSDLVDPGDECAQAFAVDRGAPAEAGRRGRAAVRGLRGGSVKMSARAMVAPLRSVSDRCSSSTLRRYSAEFSEVIETSRIAILSLSSRNAAHVPRTVDARPPHPSPARRARASRSTSSASSSGVAGSQLSLIENGKREPKLSLLQAIATATGVDVTDLLSSEPPNRRAALEIELERAQASSVFRQLGIPAVRVTKGMPGRDDRVDPRPAPRAAAPRARGDRDPRRGAAGEHRAAAADARRRQLPRRDRAARREAAQGGRARVRRAHAPHREHHGRAARLRADLRERPAALRAFGHRPGERPHLPATGVHPRRPRPAVDGAAGDGPPAARAISVRPTTPTSCSSGSRSTTSPRAASCPRRPRSPSSVRRSSDRNLAVEDFRDAFGVTHEAAAMRMTNLLTQHLGIRLHFLRADGSGAISRVYENDDLPLPHDVTGAVEGQIALPAVPGALGVRRAQPHDRALPVHRHSGGHLLVLDADRVDRRRGVLDHGRRPVRRREVVPRARDAETRDLDVPRRVVLPAPAG